MSVRQTMCQLRRIPPTDNEITFLMSDQSLDGSLSIKRTGIGSLPIDVILPKIEMEIV